jgi:hypothetical protein
MIPRNSPYLAQERIGQAIMLSACRTVSQARVLVFAIKSTAPFLNDTFQNAQFVIINRMVNGSPVWTAVDAPWV